MHGANRENTDAMPSLNATGVAVKLPYDINSLQRNYQDEDLNGSPEETTVTRIHHGKSIQLNLRNQNTNNSLPILPKFLNSPFIIRNGNNNNGSETNANKTLAKPTIVNVRMKSFLNKNSVEYPDKKENGAVVLPQINSAKAVSMRENSILRRNQAGSPAQFKFPEAMGSVSRIRALGKEEATVASNNGSKNPTLQPAAETPSVYPSLRKLTPVKISTGNVASAIKIQRRPQKQVIHTANVASSSKPSDEEGEEEKGRGQSMSPTSAKLRPLNKSLNLKQQLTNEFRHLAFSPNIPRRVLEDHLLGALRSLLYVKTCLRPPSPGVLASKRLKIQPHVPEKPRTLVLDLDETLVYVDKSHIMRENSGNSRLIRLPSNTPDALRKICKVRPHLTEFLESVAENFEVIIFTASSEDYANLVVEIIDPERKIIKNILHREQCLETRLGVTIKDLRVIENRDLKRMVIVDNLAHVFGFQMANGIPIVEWRGDKKDTELKYLSSYLNSIAKEDDLQHANRNYCKLEQLIEKYSELIV